jgi:hypothetical protein
MGRTVETRLPDKVTPTRTSKLPINTPTSILTLSDFTFGCLTLQLKHPDATNAESDAPARLDTMKGCQTRADTAHAVYKKQN